jgi:hypothetical protein
MLQSDPGRKSFPRGTIMKLITVALVAAWVMSGCIAGSSIPHEDSPGVENRDAGPALCADTTQPPCIHRD